MGMGTIWDYRSVIEADLGEMAWEFEEVVRKYQREQFGIEQDRIIKLLEAPEFHHTFFGAREVDDETVVLHDGECIGCKAIALIKGETK